MDEELKTLVERSRRCDKQAFESLVRRYQRFVFRVVYGILPNTADAEDVTQETFLKAYISLPTLRDAEAFPSWLARTATRLAINAATRNPRWSLVPPEDIAEAAPGGSATMTPVGTDPEAGALAAETSRAVHAGLRSLPVHYRAPLVLRELQGHSYNEIADLLGIPEGTVKSRIHMARQMLQRYLTEGGM